MRDGSEKRNVWAPLRAKLDKLHWHYQRIEAKLVSGIPDVNIHIPGKGDVWIEMKYSEPNKSGSISLELRREQYIWIRDGRKAGRNIQLLFRTSPNSLWYLWRDYSQLELAKKSFRLSDNVAEAFSLPDLITRLQA